jgi:hypothetical protein
MVKLREPYENPPFGLSFVEARYLAAPARPKEVDGAPFPRPKRR